MRDKYGTGEDPDCWPGTSVLKNKLQLHDEAELAVAEADFAAAAVQNITIGPPPFDVTYLKRLHRQLFGDVYAWAGHFRKVDITKGDTRFCTASRIEPEATKVLDLLPRFDSSTQDPHQFLTHVAYCYGELNMVHPFREGNGRTQRLFFEHWLLTLGYGTQWDRVQRDEWIAACVAAVGCDYAALTTIFERCISPVESP